MSQLSEITLHLPINEVEQRYKRCRDATVKSWWQTIWLRMQGKRTTEVSRIMGCRPDWVRRLVRRWNQLGSDGLEDRRKLNGRFPLLSPEQQMRLHKALYQIPLNPIVIARRQSRRGNPESIDCFAMLAVTKWCQVKEVWYQMLRQHRGFLLAYWS
jgi:hypothetical protein